MRRFGPYRLDATNQTVTGPSGRIELPPKTFCVLQHLVENSGRLLRHDELLAAVWPSTYVQPEILKTHIRALRRALQDDVGAPHFIETRPRLGYRFIAEVSHDDDATLRPVLDGKEEEAATLPGRDAVLRQMRAALAAAVAGERRVIFITGEAGSGKSALLDVLAAGVRHDLWLGIGRAGRCGSSEPLQPLLEILGGWCRGRNGAALRQLMALHAPSCRRLVAAALGTTAEPRRAAQDMATARTIREAADLLEAMAELRPVLLVLDDLHLADDATVALIATIARRPSSHRIMVVASARPPMTARVPDALRRLVLDLLVHREAVELPLPSLTGPDIAAWLSQDGAAPPEALVQLLARHSDGNPMLALALRDHLVDQGVALRDADGQWRLGGTLPTRRELLEAPRAVQMLDLELEALDQAERQALDAASIAGSVFCSWSIYSVLEITPSMAEDLCRRLCHHGLLSETGQRLILPDGTVVPRFAFTHGLFRDILHGRQATARRASWHRCLGERAEANWGDRAHVIAAELAYRFREGGDWHRAILYSRHAARGVLETEGVEAAAAMLRHATEHCRFLPQAERAALERELRNEIAGLPHHGRERPRERPRTH